MSITFDQIPYAMVSGYRHSYVSIQLRLNSRYIIGAASIEYERTRTRAVVYGTSQSPLGKTRGQNGFKCVAELYVAETRALIQELGPGYGDIVFPVTVTYDEDGFGTITDTIVGCTLDSLTAGGSKGTDGLTQKMDLGPIDILFNGISDAKRPLIKRAA